MSDKSGTSSPFHAGERQVQERLGVREAIEPWARQVIRGHLPDEHQRFYARLPFIVAAARDTSGRAWASLLAGEPGFIRSPDSSTLAIDAGLVPGDALEEALTVDLDVGFLGKHRTLREAVHAGAPGSTMTDGG